MQRSLSLLANQTFDILVIGGGIHGAAIARQAASCGLKTALIEKDDFSGASSANSLKILHGGLRYLQRLEIARIFESIREQESWLRCAPHLAAPQTFISPTYRNQFRRGRTTAASAVLINNILTQACRRIPDPARQLPSGTTINRQTLMSRMPILDDANINGAAVWSDICLYDTERLVIAMLKDATSQGAIVANYVSADRLQFDEENRVSGVLASDQLTGNAFDIRARITIQATGSWSYRLLDDTPAAIPRPSMGLAMNLMIRNQHLSHQATGLLSSKLNRLLFFVPWHDVIMAGTWYRSCTADPDSLDVTEADITKGLDVLNTCFPKPIIEMDDIVAVHAGLLPTTQTVPPEQEPEFLRNYRIIDHSSQHGVNGLITALGIKYATSRSVASKTIAMACKQLNHSYTDNTRLRPVTGGDIPNMQTHITQWQEWGRNIDPHTMQHIACLFGSELAAITETIPGHEATLANLWEAITRFVIHHEMPQSLGDLLFRRIGIATSVPPDQKTIANYANIMAKELNWGPHRVTREIQSIVHPDNLWRAAIHQRH